MGLTCDGVSDCLRHAFCSACAAFAVSYLAMSHLAGLLHQAHPVAPRGTDGSHEGGGAVYPRVTSHELES
jgi:hypothetical protein